MNLGLPGLRGRSECSAPDNNQGTRPEPAACIEAGILHQSIPSHGYTHRFQLQQALNHNGRPD